MKLFEMQVNDLIFIKQNSLKIIRDESIDKNVLFAFFLEIIHPTHRFYSIFVHQLIIDVKTIFNCIEDHI